MRRYFNFAIRYKVHNIKLAYKGLTACTVHSYSVINVLTIEEEWRLEEEQWLEEKR